MADKQTEQTTDRQHEKTVFLVHLDSGRVVSVNAYSLKEAIEIAKKLDKDFKEQPNG